MENLNDVKKYHDMGFALLWLYPKSKRPIGNDWTEGERKPWKKLEKDFKKAMNVGVRLGTPSKFPDGSYMCVLDCDVKSSDPIHLKEMEKALMAFCPSHEFAPRVLSGRGGGSCHFYFRTKKPQQSFKAIRSGHKVKVFMPSVEASKADSESGLTDDELKAGYRMRLAWEVDVFGEGKQVVIPPSTHPDSLKPYVWEVNLRDWEAIPLHESFTPNKVRLVKKNEKEIKFTEVDLFSTPVSEKYFNLITSGAGFENYPSRSEALFASLNALIYAGLTDEQIFYVLTDASHFMSEKPLEAGQGDVNKSAKWLQSQVDKIRAETSAESSFKDLAIIDDLDEMLALSAEEILAQEEELVSWVTRLETTRTGYKNTAYNLYLIMKNLNAEDPSAQCVFAYDEFNQANMYTFRPPWGELSDVGRELIDLDDIRIQTWLSKEWGVEASEQRIAAITLQLGKENNFHPVQRYLKSLKWDGKERLNKLLSTYCGAVGDTRYLADVGRKFMCAGVARVMNAGVKFDHILILEGNQGIGKSTFVKVLSSPWDSDSLGDISNKDVIDNMRGKWIIELGELASMNRAESNELKAFITRQADVVRKAYGKRSQSYPRQCIFVGTTNDDEYLKDVTGGRRFWCVATKKFEIEKLQRDRDQLWAEAFVTYSLGEALYLDDAEVRAYAEEEQGDRFVVDEIQRMVKDVIESEDFPDRFDFHDIWSRMALNEGKASKKVCEYTMQIRIKKALRVLNYPKIRVRVDGDRSFLWLKKTPKNMVDSGYFNKKY
jgi:predicted P-loop ATPase